VKYILVGNGDIDQAADWSNADCVVQFNLCRHRARVPAAAARYVFISNTGTPSECSVRFLLAERDDPAIAGAVMMNARNPAFYRLKQAGLLMACAAGWRDYAVSDATRQLAGTWRVATMGFRETLKLETRMRHAGMPAAQMPSTGMVAFDWVQRRMQPEDRLELAGFSWEGWEGHAWQIERRLMA